MQEKNSEQIKKYLIYGDILFLMQSASKIDWHEIRENSIFRTLYLVSVLFSFRFPKEENPFNAAYRFSLHITGPFNPDIKSAINFLLKDEYIESAEGGEDIYKLGGNPSPDLAGQPDQKVRQGWIDTVVSILGVYGENRIYDFIFRDPEYREKLQTGSLQVLITDPENKTVEVLNRFKQAFEESISDIPEKLDNKKYIQYYFEYVFSKILKREDS